MFVIIRNSPDDYILCLRLDIGFYIDVKYGQEFADYLEIDINQFINLAKQCNAEIETTNRASWVIGPLILPKFKMHEDAEAFKNLLEPLYIMKLIRMG